MDFRRSVYRGEMIPATRPSATGPTHVAQVVTFLHHQGAGPRLRDAPEFSVTPMGVGRTAIAKVMPPLSSWAAPPAWPSVSTSCPAAEEGYKMAAELRSIYDHRPPTAHKVIEVARALENLRRQDGIHAARVWVHHSGSR